MNTFRFSTCAGLVSVAIVAAMGSVAPGAVIRTVSPLSASAAEGNSSITPSRNPIRVQHLIPASEFAGLPAANRYLVGFNFRSDQTQMAPVNWGWPSEQIWISTTSLNTLTTTFDANHGPDKKQVHNGSVSYPLLGTGPAAGPRTIADAPRLQLPFFYDPSKGNLLIERQVFDGNYPVPGTIDTVSGVTGRLLVNDPGATAPTGILLPSVPVMQFQFDTVPEPSTFVLIGPATAYLLLWRRKR
jgi:hypothetical protein